MMTGPMLNSNNDLLQQARSGKRLPPVWAVIPLTFVFLFLSQMGAIPIVMINLARRVSNLTVMTGEIGEISEIKRDVNALAQLAWPQTTLEYMLFLVSAFAGIYGLLWLWVKFVERRPFKSLGLRGENPLSKFGRGFGVGLSMMVLAIVAGNSLGFYTIEIGPILSVSALGGVLLILPGWLVQGPAEELIFRGWVLPVVSARYTLWAGIFLSSLMFATAHALNPGVSWLAILNLLLFGLFTALYALSEEGVWGVFGIHAVWNWVQGNIFGLEVSGSPLPGVSLFVIRETGPDIWTGGAFGPEGGLIVTLILGIFIGGVLFLNRR